MDRNSRISGKTPAGRMILAVLLIPAILALLTACGNPDIDISAYAGETVAIHGLPEEIAPEGTVAMTVEELASLNMVTVKTQSTSDKIGVVRATGPLLDTLLKKLGVNVTDYRKILLTARDGYEVPLYTDFLMENKVILAIGVDGQPLSGDETPLRIIIPDSDSAYWIRMVTDITLVP